MLKNIKKKIFIVISNIFLGFPFAVYLFCLANINRMTSRKYCLYEDELYIVIWDKNPWLCRLMEKCSKDKWDRVLLICKPDIKIITIPKKQEGVETIPEKDFDKVTMLKGDLKSLRMLYG